MLNILQLSILLNIEGNMLEITKFKAVGIHKKYLKKLLIYV